MQRIRTPNFIELGQKERHKKSGELKRLVGKKERRSLISAHFGEFQTTVILVQIGISKSG